VGKIHSIQILRAVAALAVMETHAQHAWDRAAHAHLSYETYIGSYGVDVFFVISGFIVWRAARKAPSAAEFLRMRFTRVAPLYYLQTAPWLVGAATGGKVFLAPLLTALLFWPIWGSHATIPLLGVGWTLCYEALFYTSLSPIVKWGKPAAVALLGAYGFAVMFNLAGLSPVFRFVGSPLLLEFLLGVTLALRPVTASPLAGLMAVIGAFVVLAIWAVHGVGVTPDAQLADVPQVALGRVEVAAVPAYLMVRGALQLEPWCKGRLARIISYLGDASYSIYLTHLLVIAGVEDVWRVLNLPAAGLGFTAFAVALLAGLLAFEFLEKPLLAFLRRKPALQPVVVAAE
jgi:exopolysaccharide production protein ExoZ